MNGGVMAEPTKEGTSQAQQHVSGPEHWKSVMVEQTARLGEVFEEASRVHAKWIEFGNNQLDEMTEFAKTGFNYVNELAADFRRLTLESTKKAMVFFAR
jgi:hypothetical protein